MLSVRYASYLLLIALSLGAFDYAVAQPIDRFFDPHYGGDGASFSGEPLSPAAMPPVSTRGGAGILDASFGEGGVSVFPAAITSGFALQPDGKILTGGNLDGAAAVFRFNPDGTADESFGTNGVTTVDFGPRDLFLSIDVQDDGKIVAAGSQWLTGGGDGDIAALARFLPDGTLDVDFGEGGLVFEPGTPESGTPDSFWHVAVRPTGEIVAGGPRGIWESGTEANECYAVQYLPDGSRDPSFGTDGVVSTVPDEDAFCLDGHLMEDGRYVLGVNVEASSFMSRWGAVRLLPDGTHDATFGQGGLALVADAVTNFYRTIVAGPDGAVTLSGGLPSASALALVRFAADGTLDADFGTEGVAVLDEAGAAISWDMLFQPDGKILLAGYRLFQSGTRIPILARALPDGSGDGSFGASGPGYTLLEFDSAPSNVSPGRSVGLDDEDRIVMTGVVEFNDTGFIARFENDPPVAVEPSVQPARLALAPPFPNPTSRWTEVTYVLAKPSPVRLALYDVLGREVAVLTDGPQAAGEHEAVLDTKQLAPGLYLLRLAAGSASVTRRLTVIR